MDEILMIGDSLYQQSINTIKSKHKHLATYEVLKTLEIGDVLLESKCDISPRSFNQFKFSQLPSEIKSFFKKHSLGVLTVSANSIAIFKVFNEQFKTNKYFIFNSHSRSETGCYAESDMGKSVLLAFKSIKDLIINL